MKGSIYKLGKSFLAPFPNAKQLLKRLHRGARTRYLKTRHPNGAFLTCNGAKVFCDFSSENYCWYDGDSEYLAYELEVFTSLFREKAPGVILDVGAHWGFYAAFLETTPHARSIAKLISVEADPANCRMLERTLAQIRHFPVVQVNGAISDKDGQTTLYSGGGSCRQTYQSESAVSVGTVPAISLDRLAETHIANGESLTHVKLDIDGHEPAFFRGGKETLKKFRPLVMMEFWAKGLKASGVDLDAYWDMLQEDYHVKEACFTSHRLNPLERKDLPYLIDKTMAGITDLVLFPKTR